MRIKNRLLFFYSLLFLSFMLLSTVVYQRVNRNIILTEISHSTEDTIEAVGQNIEKSLEWINGLSRIILANQNVQNLLNAATEEEKLTYMRSFHRYVTELKTNYPQVIGIYIIDHEKTFYFTDLKDGNQSPRKDALELIVHDDNPWYQQILAARGASIFGVNYGKLQFNTDEKQFFNCARVINDINSQQPLGLIVIDFDREMIQQAFTRLNVNENRIYTLSTDNGQVIMAGGGSDKTLGDTDGFVIRRHTDIALSGWELDYKIHQNVFFQETRSISILGVLIIAFNGILLFIGSAWIASRITNPVVELAQAMDEADLDRLEEVQLKTNIPEFTTLKDGYNRLLNRIAQLLKNVIREQRKKRKAELEALQAQIKPHFLYNTIDNINALALMKDYDKIYTMTTALGQFYRTSLNKGSEIITIREELELVRNYLSIQEIRYPNKFETTYDIDDQILDRPILKLILQPFVENALYHGIKPNEGIGHIMIRGQVVEDMICFTIEDDGVGSDDIRAFSSNHKDKKRSFGVRGTIERLRIFAGFDDVINIDSQRGHGTRIQLRIPLERRPADDEDDTFGG